jgi:hypothetical protein
MAAETGAEAELRVRLHAFLRDRGLYDEIRTQLSARGVVGGVWVGVGVCGVGEGAAGVGAAGAMVARRMWRAGRGQRRPRRN